MSRRARILPLLLALLVGGAPDDASADPPSSQRWVAGLHVADGENAWHADNDFYLSWTNAGPPGAPAVAAVHYRVRDASGAGAIGETLIPWETTGIAYLSLPGQGEYVAEVWLEDVLGLLSPRASVRLLLDQARPRVAEPLLPPGWIAGGAAVHLRFEHPAAPLPISGIHGYAVSIDGDPEGSPCAAPDRCGDAETDLRSGIDGDSLILPSLPEGTSYVHAVAVSGAGMSSERVATAVARVDATVPRVAIDGVPSGWASGPVKILASASDGLSGMRASGPDGPFTAISVDGDLPVTGSGAAATAVVSGEGVHRVDCYARDAAGNVNDGSGAGDPPSTATVRIDTGAPAVAFANPRDPSDPERIEAVVSDPRSGPSAARGTVAVRPSGSRQPFAPLPTTVSAGRLVARWDSDDFPAGSYEFQATGYDAAGNSAASGLRANGSRMVLVNPLKAQTAIEAGFGGRRLVWHRCVHRGDRRRCRREAIGSYDGRPTARTVPYNRAVPFSGRLASVAGSPLEGQAVQVVETFDGGAGLTRRATTVRTDADGTFLARLSPGPSRRVEAVFPGTRTLSRALAEPFRLDVRDGIQMRVSSASARIGGAPVVFTGALAHADAALPPGGLPVALQFRAPGVPWTEFRTVQTDRRGRFRYPYAFADDDSRGIRFQFRATLATEIDWPYEPGSSRPVFVTGR